MPLNADGSAEEDSQVDIIMGPARKIDSWAMWLVHRTPWLGPWLHHRDWSQLVDIWVIVISLVEFVMS
jgi:hypothetical protein